MATASWDTFQAWADEFELSPDTIKLLHDNAFTSIRSCKLLNASLIQKNFSKSIPLGQTLLLQQGVEALTDPVTSTSPVRAQVGSNEPGGSDVIAETKSDPKVSSNLEQGLDLTSILKLLDSDKSANSVDTVTHSRSGKPQIFDPFQFGETSSGTNSTVRDIRDFVTLFPERSERTSVRLGDVELSLPDSKPKIDHINQLQYMEASLRIMREMALKDGDSLEKILQYAGYLIKIANMGQRFLWKSVMKYDSEYRKAQALSNFAWGADNSFMMQIFLRDDPSKTSFTRNDTSNSHSKFDPASGKPVCNRYNSVQGCRMRNCRYVHVCRVCFSREHTGVSHRSPSITTTQAPGSKNGL